MYRHQVGIATNLATIACSLNNDRLQDSIENVTFTVTVETIISAICCIGNYSKHHYTFFKALSC